MVNLKCTISQSLHNDTSLIIDKRHESNLQTGDSPCQINTGRGGRSRHLNSRNKGAAGERELAKILREYGYEKSRRGQQFCGSNGDADVVGLPGIHIECKRVEKLNIYDAMKQSQNDGKDGEAPAVFHRKNNKPWLVTMTMDEWMKMYKASTELLPGKGR